MCVLPHASFRLSLFPQVTQLIVSDRAAGGLDHSGVNSQARLEGKTLNTELLQELMVNSERVGQNWTGA
jgi:hypothetical protein